MKKIVYLSLGSNLGDRQVNLRNAIGRLLELGDVLEVSSLYETEPVEFTDQPEERPYGIDSGFRDPSGNALRLTEVRLPASV